MTAWVDVVRGSVREVHSYALLLTGRDAEAAQGLVRTGYATLAEAYRLHTEVDAPARAVRRVVRRRWIEHLAGVAPQRKAHNGGSRLLADLPAHVRTIVVLKAIDGMPSERVARETGVEMVDIDRLYEQSLTWLGVDAVGVADAGREWIRAHVGEILDPPPSLVEQLVTEFQPASERPDRSSLVATYAVGVGELDATPPRGRTSFLADPTADVVGVDADDGDNAAGEASGGAATDVDPEAEPEVQQAPTATSEPPSTADDSGETRRRRGLRRLLALR